ncbi:MAG: Asp-tRNA(Asn)/Glu-tRNA(Gln) amidotransferase subunit GatC [Eubacterium sp.]|jgi:aspartyl-tRNA(Asn)/glutamyl-tRNA(Gln) amidotransferase subunit C|nr:Asp-tRNA(Asn)/Glu-tRNA(Gln) amidotransferase subunit GatC [Eubacterium sp.]
MQITDETIEYVGILAKLELSPEEKERAKQDMSEMLDYVGKLNELDVSGVEPMSHTFPVSNVMREDAVTNGDDREKILANAPEKTEEAFIVPNTF